MYTLFGRLTLMLRVLNRTFRMRAVPLVALALWGMLRLVTWVAMAADPLFFPRLRKAQVRKPIVLVGNPRTGTTFLQRFLSDEGYGAGLEVYRMLYPSLVLQKLIGPFLPWLEAVSPARYHSTKAHDTNLVSVETDDVGILFRHFDGFFLYGFFLAFAEEDLAPSFGPEVRDTSARDFDWLEALWRRSVVAHGHDVVVAKLFSLGTRTPDRKSVV